MLKSSVLDVRLDSKFASAKFVKYFEIFLSINSWNHRGLIRDLSNTYGGVFLRKQLTALREKSFGL